MFSLAVTVACSEEPHGRWQATERVEVLPEKFNPSGLAFYIEKGEICALSDKWHNDKDFSYKEVNCAKGRGWIITDDPFKNSKTEML